MLFLNVCVGDDFLLVCNIVLQYCRDMGGYLLEVDSAAEQQVIERLIPFQTGLAYWIGLEKNPGVG